MDFARKEQLQRFTMLGWINAPFVFTGAQLLTQAIWEGPRPYRPVVDAISDLGQRSCKGIADAQSQVCSPGHSFFNSVSAIVGLALFVGLFALREVWWTQKRDRIAWWLIAASCVGWLLASAFPQDSVGLLHGLGAGLIFFVGPIGVFMSGKAWVNFGHPHVGRAARPVAITCVVAGLLFVLSIDFGIGGLLERISAYATMAWLAGAGGAVLANGVHARGALSSVNSSKQPGGDGN